MSRAPERDRYDVLVIGGGPGGSTTAALVREGGHRVLLLDREPFPRFRLGESLMPATYWTLERLGVLEKMRCSRFPDKHSVQFFTASGKTAAPFYFSEVDEHESSQTWQVDRAEFDQMLAENARDRGVELCDGVSVREVLFEGDRAVGARIDPGDGSRREIRARVVVDASGQGSLLARQLDLRLIDPLLKNCSFYTRYRGARLDTGRDRGATLIYWTREKSSWFWFIPLPEGLVSVGAVGSTAKLLEGRARDPQVVFDEELELCPLLQERLQGAERIEPTRVIRDFSYVSRRIAGDGWVMVGDAFGFLDPIYSSGVFLALKSGEMAADSILAAFEKNDFSAEQLGEHGDCYLAGMEAMRRLVYAYYDESFHFGRFLKRFPECREPLVHLLVGNVFQRPMEGLFEAMGELIELPEARRLQDLAAAG